MTKKLREEDRRAIDMLLDRLPSTVGNGGNGGNGGHPHHVGFATTMGNGFQHRIQAVEHLLKNLDDMPAGDPPADLLARTIQRLEQSRPASAAKLPPGIGDPSQPHA